MSLFKWSNLETPWFWGILLNRFHFIFRESFTNGFSTESAKMAALCLVRIFTRYLILHSKHSLKVTKCLISRLVYRGGQQNRPRWLHYAWWKFSPDALFCIQSILQKCWKLLFNVSFCGWVSSQSDQPAALHSLKCLPVLFVEIEKMFDFYTIVYAILNIIDNCDVFFYSPPTLFSAFLANIRIGIKS